MSDKLYFVEKISFYSFSATIRETNKTVENVPVKEIFDVTDMVDHNFSINFGNWHGKLEDFVKIVKEQKSSFPKVA